MPIRKHVVVTGFFQGVSYRRHTQRIATSLGVKGWVRNLSDGGVEACMEGDESSVDALLSWCAFGPKYGRVEEVLVVKDLYSGSFPDFSVLDDRRVA